MTDIPNKSGLATKEDLANLRADFAKEFKALYRFLFVWGTGIIFATVAIDRFLG